MTPTMSGNVTNGPTPTISITFRPNAEAVDSPRRSSVGGCCSGGDRFSLLRGVGSVEGWLIRGFQGMGCNFGQIDACWKCNESLANMGPNRAWYDQLQVIFPLGVDAPGYRSGASLKETG